MVDGPEILPVCYTRFQARGLRDTTTSVDGAHFSIIFKGENTP